VGNGARLMFRFEDLPEIVLGEYHRVFLGRRSQAQVADVDQVSPQGQMGSMFFEDAERKQTGPLGALDGLNEVCSRELFPSSREPGLRPGAGCHHEQKEEERKQSPEKLWSFHETS